LRGLPGGKFQLDAVHRKAGFRHPTRRTLTRLNSVLSVSAGKGSIVSGVTAATGKLSSGDVRSA
jgi:hypothetical protein